MSDYRPDGIDSVCYAATKDALETMAERYGATVEWDSEGLPALSMPYRRPAPREPAAVLPTLCALGPDIQVGDIIRIGKRQAVVIDVPPPDEPGGWFKFRSLTF